MPFIYKILHCTFYGQVHNIIFSLCVGGAFFCFSKIYNINSALRYVKSHVKDMHQHSVHKMFMPGHTPSNCWYSVCMSLHI